MHAMKIKGRFGLLALALLASGQPLQASGINGINNSGMPNRI
jgi:hypothetical protein